MIVSIIAYLLYDSLSVLLALCLMLNPIGLLQLYPIYSLLLYPIGFLLLYSIGSLHILSHWFYPGLFPWLSPSALPHWLSPALSHELFPVRFCLLVLGFVLSLKDCFFYPLLCFFYSADCHLPVNPGHRLSAHSRQGGVRGQGDEVGRPELRG